jgi:hypothetical protein
MEKSSPFALQQGVRPRCLWANQFLNAKTPPRSGPENAWRAFAPGLFSAKAKLPTQDHNYK